MQLARNKLSGPQPPQDDAIRYVKFAAVNCCNSQQGQQHWCYNFSDFAGIVFLVDATDYKRFIEVETGLHALLAMEKTIEVPLEPVTAQYGGGAVYPGLTFHLFWCIPQLRLLGSKPQHRQRARHRQQIKSTQHRAAMCDESRRHNYRCTQIIHGRFGLGLIGDKIGW